MHFPTFTDDHRYVLIARADGLPCGARSWCQIACGFATHMQKARTLLYNWTLDLALVSEHETDLVRVLFGEPLKKIQQIIDRGYMLLRGFWVRTVVIIGGDSPWLRHILGLSTFYEIGSIYSFATWCREKERWVGCEWQRSTRLEAKFLKYRKQGVSRVGAKGCIQSPLLKVNDSIGCVIMCVLHLVIRCGEYLTTFVRTRATILTVPQRSKVQSLLKDAKTNTSLQGRAFPDEKETWHLFANWLHIAKSLHLTPRVTTIVQDMGKLLTAIYRWTYDPFVQGCAQIAKRFPNTICPHKRSPYLLWLRNEGAIVLRNLQPWGGGSCFVATLLSRLTMFLKTTLQSGRCCVWACRATPKATCPWMNQVWMPCSGYGPLRGAVLPGASPGLARIPWDGAVVTAQDTVHASASRPRWSCHQFGSTNQRSSGTGQLRAACSLWPPPSQVRESTRRPRQAPRRQQRRQRQWHHRHWCRQVCFYRSKRCNRCAVVQRSFQRVKRCD